MRLSRFSRMLQIVIALQSGRNNRVEDLARFHTVSRRTIFRDMQELKEIGIECRYNGETNTYSTGQGFFLPPVNLQRIEAMVLLLLARKATNFMVVPFKNAMLHAAMRLENNLPAEIREFCNSSLRDISIRGNLKVQPGWGDGIFWRIQKAIIEKRILSIKYHPDCDVESISTDLSPYHLLYNDYVWYVIGGSSFHRRASAFKLNRIKGLEVLNRRFIEAGDFDINSYLGKAWSMRREGRLYNIRLRFLPEVAQSVAEVQWHNTQKVSFKDDGSVIVEFIVDGLSEITWWILSYGNRVQVLTPRILRQRVIAIARNVTWSARPK